MKLTSSIIIATAVLFLGLFIKQQALWVPISVLIAGLIEAFTRSWIMSPKLGSATGLSMLLKFCLSLVGLYAGVGQFACIFIAIAWIFF